MTTVSTLALLTHRVSHDDEEEVVEGDGEGKEEQVREVGSKWYR